MINIRFNVPNSTWNGANYRKYVLGAPFTLFMTSKKWKIIVSASQTTPETGQTSLNLCYRHFAPQLLTKPKNENNRLNVPNDTWNGANFIKSVLGTLIYHSQRPNLIEFIIDNDVKQHECHNNWKTQKIGSARWNCRVKWKLIPRMPSHLSF